MSLDERDYMHERHRASERAKAQQEKALKARFAKFGGARGTRTTRKSVWHSVPFVAGSLLIGLVVLVSLPKAVAWFSRQHTAAPFPPTGAVRWFVAPVVDSANAATLTIRGRSAPGGNMVLQLDSWEGHTPVALIPIRENETATLQVPLGRYRIRYASTATWQSDLKLQGDVQEALEPMDFYRTGNTITGHTIDLNNRINGNLKTRRTSLL